MVENPEEKKLNPAVIAAIIVLAAFVVLEGVAVFLMKVDTSGYPTVIVGIVETLKWIFAAAPVAIALGWGRNIYGYIVNWLRAKRKAEPTAEYSIKWLTETIGKFEGWIVLVTPFVNIVILNLPAEYKQIGMIASGAAFALFDIALSEIKRVIAEARKNGG